MDVLARLKSHYVAVPEEGQTTVPAVPAATWLVTPAEHKQWEFEGKEEQG